MKQPSGNVLIINLFHTLIKDSWQPLVFAAAVQQESDAGELHLREKRLPGIKYKHHGFPSHGWRRLLRMQET